MPKAPTRDRSILYTVAAAFLLLLVGFVGAWIYQKHKAALRSETVYSQPTRVTASNHDYSVAVRFAIQTRGDNARWVGDHKAALQAIVQQALITDDVRQAREPGGLPRLEQRLRRTINSTLHTDKVQQVVITDFLVSESSY